MQERAMDPQDAIIDDCVGGDNLRYVDVDRILPAGGRPLPKVIKLLLENVIRTGSGAERRRSVDAIAEWRHTGTSTREVEIFPGRLLMHDTTSTPALVDIAAMRDVLTAEGLDPSRLNPVLPVEVSVDHSLAVKSYGRQESANQNLEADMSLNRERYTFLKWAAATMRNVHINPPGTGIMHTINLEQLATVAAVEKREGKPWAVPDLMIGTDSHTPMVNALGVLGWGVGGLEAQTVMFGMPVAMRIPEVIGVKLTNALTSGVTATDLALRVTSALRSLGVTGACVEFYGPGVSTLSVGSRAVIANMAPEYGATTGYFPIDDHTLDYLRGTGRSAAQVAFVEDYSRRAGLWFDPAVEPIFTESIEIDLADIVTTIAGPRRPQDACAAADLPAVLHAGDGTRAPVPPEHGAEGDPRRKPASSAPGTELPRFPIALASITSCTNTTDPALLITAGLLAKAAHERGMNVPPWVKTSLAPGSPAAATYLNRAGLMPHLSAVGFDIVGFGCATCIGNSGDLPEAIACAPAGVQPVAALSGNRNFPGRVHPELELGLLMSPPLVIAFALAGRADLDITTEVLGADAEGFPVRLSDLWPSEQAVQDALRAGLSSEDFSRDFRAASASALWRRIEAPEGETFPWDEESSTLRRPPFGDSRDPVRLGIYAARALVSLGDDITTDHISPASAIPNDSAAAAYLESMGVRERNVFASYRGNWEVMVRGAYDNRSITNRLAPTVPPGHSIHSPSGRVLPLSELAELYRGEGENVVVVAGERYGMGSSRDWAAKAPWLLGIRAVLADSFERIHRTNLIGMGILPLVIPPEARPIHSIAPGDVLRIGAAVSDVGVRGSVPVVLERVGGEKLSFVAEAAVDTAHELDLLRAGGVIPFILDRERSSGKLADTPVTA